MMVASDLELARQEPLLIVLDDCHWLDPLSRDLVEAVAHALAPQPVLLLLAYRPPANIDTLVGELAVPRERILPGQVGRVDLRGSGWSARNDAAISIETGQRCRVTAVDGLTVYVQPE